MTSHSLNQHNELFIFFPSRLACELSTETEICESKIGIRFSLAMIPNKHRKPYNYGSTNAKESVR